MHYHQYKPHHVEIFSSMFKMQLEKYHPLIPNILLAYRYYHKARLELWWDNNLEIYKLILWGKVTEVKAYISKSYPRELLEYGYIKDIEDLIKGGIVKCARDFLSISNLIKLGDRGISYESEITIRGKSRWDIGH